jgi:hypothetical protein
MSRIKHFKPGKAKDKMPEKKKGVSKAVILTLIIGGVMLLSTFAIMFSGYNSGQDTVPYGDYTFKRTTGGWMIKVDGKEAKFGYHPADLENINLSSDITKKLAESKVLYVTFNPNTKHVDRFELARFELGQSLIEFFNIYSMPGITENNSAYKQNMVTCANATSTVPVISLVEGNETKISMENDCVTLEADQYVIGALKDRLLYSMLGVMK